MSTSSGVAKSAATQPAAEPASSADAECSSEGCSCSTASAPSMASRICSKHTSSTEDTSAPRVMLGPRPVHSARMPSSCMMEE